MTNAKLEIKLIASSLGTDRDDIDELMILEAFDHNGESCQVHYRIDAHGGEHIVTHPGAHKLVGVYSGLHLVQLVTQGLMQALTPEHEFMHDIFLAEDGMNIESKVLTIEVPTPNWAGM